MTDFKELKKLSKSFTLLFVEDDSILREQTAKIFSNLFKSVDTAEHGKDGLELYNDYYKKTGKYYDILVSDIEMPYLDGIELSSKVLAVNPAQQIVIMSAYDDKEYLLGLIEMGIEYFMQKPLSTEHLLDIMHKVCISFENESSISFGDGYYFDTFLKVLFNKAKRIDISYNETMLLELFLKDKHKVFSIDEIFNYVYADSPVDGTKEELVKDIVHRLSDKLPIGVIKRNDTVGYSLSVSI